MADYFDRSGRGSDRNSFDRNNGDGGYDYREDNNFDRRYSSNNGRRDRSRGFFDRRIPDRGDNFERQLPPIEPQNQPPYGVGQAYAAPINGGQNTSPVQPVPQQQSAPRQNVFSISNVMLFSPTSYADVQTLIDHLKRHEPAIVDFQNVDNDSGQRILDFLSGAIYALSGSMQRISGTIFLLTPSGVSITAPADISKSIEDRRNKK